MSNHLVQLELPSLEQVEVARYVDRGIGVSTLAPNQDLTVVKWECVDVHILIVAWNTNADSLSGVASQPVSLLDQSDEASVLDKYINPFFTHDLRDLLVHIHFG